MKNNDFNKSKMDVLSKDNLYKFKSFEDKDYINFLKKSGGQVFQYYSLLDSYASLLGAGAGPSYSTDYREAEVVFSREIFKKNVYSSVILPLYIDDSSTSDISVRTGTGNTPGGSPTDEESYFKPRITPSWFDRHAQSADFVEGILRNVYLKASAPAETHTNTGATFLSGEFRLPLLTYFHREVESFTTVTDVAFEGGMLKKVLLRAKIPTESFTSTGSDLLTFAKSTVTDKDLLIMDFKDVNYLLSSPKADASVLDSFFTKVSKNEDAPNILRVLNKRGGVKLRFDNYSVGVSPYYDWTLSFKFQSRESSPGSRILYYRNLLEVFVDKRDPSKLLINISGESFFVSDPGTLSLNMWYQISIEYYKGVFYVYLNDSLLKHGTYPKKWFFEKNTEMYLGNSSGTYEGFVGNFSEFLIAKKVALKTQKLSQVYNSIKPVVGSELDFSDESIKDKSPFAEWKIVNGLSYIPEQQGVVMDSGKYMYLVETPDVSIYPFNNFKIELKFELDGLPTLDNQIKTLLHKVGQYSLSVRRVDDTARIYFSIGDQSLTTLSALKPSREYHVEVVKYLDEILLFVNNVFQKSLTMNDSLSEDNLSTLYVGRYLGNPERNFKGVLRFFKIINYFEDSKYLEYLPKNQKFEEGIPFETPIEYWDPSNPEQTDNDMISTEEPKFGETSGRFGDENKALTSEPRPVYNFGTDDFTYEGWSRPTEFREESILISNGIQKGSVDEELLQYLFIDSEGFVSFYADQTVSGTSSNILIKSTTKVALDAWNHIVFTRESGVFRIYIDGKLSQEVVENNVNIDLSANGTYIGNNNSRGDVAHKAIPGSDSGVIEVAPPTTVESLESFLDKKGIIALPETPTASIDPTDGSLVLGDNRIVPLDDTEAGILGDLVINGYLDKEMLKSVINKDSIVEWLKTPGILAKQPDYSKYQVLDPKPSSESEVEKELSKGSVIELPSPAPSINPEDGSITLGEQVLTPSSDKEKGLIETWIDKGFLNEGDLESMPSGFDITPWVSLEGVVIKQPPITTLPPGEEVNDTQFVGGMDSYLVTKGESLYPGGLDFDVPTEDSSDDGRSLIANLSFDGQARDSSDQEMYLDFNKHSKIESVSPIAINSESVEMSLKGSIPSNAQQVIFNMDGVLENIGDYPLEYVEGTNNFTTFEGEQVLNSSYKVFYITSKDNTKNFFGDLTGDFSIDLWLYETSEPSNWWKIFDNNAARFGGPESSGGYFLTYSRSNNQLDRRSLEGGVRSKLPLKTWNHLALSKSDGHLICYINGQPVYNKEVNPDYHNFSEDVGIAFLGSGWNSGEFPRGYIKNLRLIKGFTPFTKSFDPELLRKPSPELNRVFKTVEDSNGVTVDTNNTLFDEPVINFTKGFLSTNHLINRSYTTYTLESYFKIKELSISNLLNIDDKLFLKISSTGLEMVLEGEAFPIEILESIEEDVWYNILVTVDDYLINVYVNGIKQKSFKPKSQLSIGESTNIIIGEEGLFSALLSGFKLNPGVVSYKDSFELENKYISQDDIVYQPIEEPSKIYDNVSKQFLGNLQNSTTHLENSSLVTWLPQDSSSTGALLNTDIKALDIKTKDFTILVGVSLPVDRIKDHTDIFMNRSSSSSATFINITSPSFSSSSYSSSEVQFHVRRYSVNMRFGENSFIEGIRNTIVVTREGDILRGFVNGVQKVELEINPVLELDLNSYGGLRLLGGKQSNEGSLHTMYVLKGQALNTSSSQNLSSVKYLKNVHTDRYEVTLSDNTNVIPHRAFVENLYSREEDFALVSNWRGISKEHLTVDMNTYAKLNYIGRIPKDFKLSFWFRPFYNNPSTDYHSVMKWESEDQYKLEYLVKPNGANRFEVSLKGVVTYSSSSNAIFNEEWNHITIAKFKNSVSIYVNGFRLRKHDHITYEEYSSNKTSNMHLGHNPSKEVDSAIFEYDELVIEKYRQTSLMENYYNPLESIVEDSYVAETIVNGDGSKGILGWQSSQGTTFKPYLDPKLMRYYFTLINGSSPIYQVVDVSDYLDLTGVKVLLKWAQSKDPEATTNSLSGCNLIFLDKDQEEIYKSVSNMYSINTTTNLEREVERYLVDRVPVNCKYIKIVMNLSEDAYITDLQLYLKEPGIKIEHIDYKQEFIEPGTEVDYSHSLLLSHVDLDSETPHEKSYSTSLDITGVVQRDSDEQDLDSFYFGLVQQTPFKPVFNDYFDFGQISTTK